MINNTYYYYVHNYDRQRLAKLHRLGQYLPTWGNCGVINVLGQYPPIQHLVSCTTYEFTRDIFDQLVISSLPGVDRDHQFTDLLEQHTKTEPARTLKKHHSSKQLGHYNKGVGQIGSHMPWVHCNHKLCMCLIRKCVPKKNGSGDLDLQLIC